MKNENITKLLDILKNTHSNITAAALAKMIGTSEKTIRNYIKRINEEGKGKIIPSKNGYRLSKTTHQTDFEKNEELNYRENMVLSKLLANKEGVSIFELSDELCLSESTIINTVLPSIKKIISKFQLSIQSHNYIYKIMGQENNKRKLIGYIVTHNNYGYFTSTETLEKLFPSINVKEVLNKLNNICNKSNLFLNDYSLSNFIIHILIIWVRIQSDNTIEITSNYSNIEKIINNSNQKEEIIHLATSITSILEDNQVNKISNTEFQQIISLIVLSVDNSFENLENVIEPQFIDNIFKIASEISNRFYIPNFDHNFLRQFSIHVYNAYHRSKFNLSYPNPIAQQIKTDYAPIYDMAIFFAHKFSLIYNIEMNEDEIAFIGFHFGAYLENNKHNIDSISCIIICEKYHDFTKQLATQIKNTFQDIITIMDIMSLSQFNTINPKVNLFISTLPLNITHEHVVLINPILTKQNIRSIWTEIENIQEEKAVEKGKLFLKELLNKKLYLRNIICSSPQEYIKYMGNICLKYDFIENEFINDVLLRESISSTAFTNNVAIPHTISKYAKKSFICVIHNDNPLLWEDKKIHFIFMVGISENDMRYFNDTLNLLINLFSSNTKTLELINTKTFEQFTDVILNINQRL